MDHLSALIINSYCDVRIPIKAPLLFYPTPPPSPSQADGKQCPNTDGVTLTTVSKTSA